MDNLDSRITHPSEASTDERAFSPPAEALPARKDIFPADRRFATRSEEEAYWRGVRAGAEAAASAGSVGASRLRSALDFDLGRGSDAPCLVSGRLADPDRPAGAGNGPARAARHDGWNRDKRRIFLTALAETGVVADACRACGMSRDAAYSLRNSTCSRPSAITFGPTPPSKAKLTTPMACASSASFTSPSTLSRRRPGRTIEGAQSPLALSASTKASRQARTSSRSTLSLSARQRLTLSALGISSACRMASEISSLL